MSLIKLIKLNYILLNTAAASHFQIFCISHEMDQTVTKQ